MNTQHLDSCNKLLFFWLSRTTFFWYLFLICMFLIILSSQETWSCGIYFPLVIWCKSFVLIFPPQLFWYCEEYLFMQLAQSKWITFENIRTILWTCDFLLYTLEVYHSSLQLRINTVDDRIMLNNTNLILSYPLL